MLTHHPVVTRACALLVACVAALLLLAGPALAHDVGTTTLLLDRRDGAAVTLDVPLAALDDALGTDAASDPDGADAAALAAYVVEGLDLRTTDEDWTEVLVGAEVGTIEGIDHLVVEVDLPDATDGEDVLVTSTAVVDQVEDHQVVVLTIAADGTVATAGAITSFSTTLALGADDDAGSLLAGLWTGTGDVGDAFSDVLDGRELTLGVGAVALAVATLLGGLHAVAPGHGKTIMAAYLLGEGGDARRRTRDALLLGLTVAVTHTGGVLVLGLVIGASATVASGGVQRWLGAASGLMVLGIGLGLLRRARRGDGPALLHGHVHAADGGDHDHGHHHHDAHTPSGHGHVHRGAGDGVVTDPAPSVELAPTPVGAAATVAVADRGDRDRDGLGAVADAPSTRGMSRWSLVGMGLAGGMVPSPSALVVLLGALALGRAWFGLAVVIAYGVGMALALVGAGLLLSRLRHRLEGALGSRRGRTVAAVLPTLTALAVVLGGAWLTYRSLA